MNEPVLPDVVLPEPVLPDVVLPGAPALGPSYARALLTSRAPRRPVLPERALVVPPQVVDADQVAAYARVCGWALKDEVPLLHPHLLVFAAQVRLMVTEPFPFALPGLLHTRQRVVAHRPLRVGEPARVRVHARDLVARPKGASVDLVAVVDVDGERVWEGTSTYLARGARVAGPVVDVPRRPVVDGVPAAVWSVAADTGRRYAAVSGDVNPIHLSALSARTAGMPRAVAHGMWTLARALAPLQGRLWSVSVSVDATFRSPLLLPSTVGLVLAPVDGGWDLAVRPSVRAGGASDRVHVQAAVRHLNQ